MKTYVRDNIKPWHHDSTKNVRNVVKLYVKAPDDKVRNLTINYLMSKMTTRLLSKSETIYSVYNEAFVCNPEVNHKFV